MTPEEVEVLLHRIPELHPPPALQGRILGQTRPAARRRRLHAATAAAALLFFVGVGWILRFPHGTGRPAVGSQADEPVRIRIEHDAACDAYDKEALCGNERHWKFVLGDRRTTELQGDLERAGRPGRGVVLLGSPAGPWSAVRRVLDAAVAAGFTAMEWPERRKVALPVPLPPKPPERVILEEIRICLSRDAGKGETIRRIGNRKPSASDEDLMATVLAMTRDYKKAGKTEWPVFIDPAPDVPWRDVIHAVDLCSKAGLERVEFVPSPDRPAARLAPPEPPAPQEESPLVPLQKDLDAGRTNAAVKTLAGMIARSPDTALTVRAMTRVTARAEEGAGDAQDAAVVRDYRRKWLTIAPAVYDALLQQRRVLDANGRLDLAALAASPKEIADSLALYLEQGILLRELGRSGKKFQFDNASTVFSNVLRVVQLESEPWWTAKYEVLATLVARGAESDLKLARVGLENLERSHPNFDQNQFGLKDRFLRLKRTIETAGKDR
jgi:hypothetical protein